MKSIRKWLEEDAGIKLGITSLSSYISRIRRREATARQSDADVRTGAGLSNRRQEPPHDPLAQAMQALSKRRFDIREAHGDGDPQDKNLI